MDVRIGPHGAYVQGGERNTAVTVKLQRRLSYTPSEADLYDMCEEPTVYQTGKNNNSFDFRLLSTVPDLQQTARPVQETRLHVQDESVAALGTSHSCDGDAVAAISPTPDRDEGEGRTARCLHFRVFKGAEVIQIGAKCLSVTINILKENFEELMKTGILGVTDPATHVPLFNMTWKEGAKNIKSRWKACADSKFLQCENDVINGMYKWIQERDYRAMKAFIHDTLERYKAELISLSVGCFVLEFQHDSMDSVILMLGSMEVLKTDVIGFLASDLPGDLEKCKDKFELDLEACVVDGQEVNVINLKEQFCPDSSAFPDLRSREEDGPRGTWTEGDTATCGTLTEESSGGEKHAPAESALRQSERDSHRAIEGAITGQNDRMSYINRRVDEQTKKFEQIAEKSSSGMEGILQKLKQMSSLMEQERVAPLQASPEHQTGVDVQLLRQSLLHAGSPSKTPTKYGSKQSQQFIDNALLQGVPLTEATVGRVVDGSLPPGRAAAPPPSASGGQGAGGAGSATNASSATPVPASAQSTALAASGGVQGYAQHAFSASQVQGPVSFPSLSGKPSTFATDEEVHPTPRSVPGPSLGMGAAASAPVLQKTATQPGDWDRRMAFSKSGPESLGLPDFGAFSPLEIGGHLGKDISPKMEKQNSDVSPDDSLALEETPRKAEMKDGRHGPWGGSDVTSLQEDYAGRPLPARTASRSARDPGTRFQSSDSGISLPEGNSLSGSFGGKNDPDEDGTRNVIAATEAENNEEARKYLKRIHVAVSDILQQSVKLALADEYPPPPRSKGTDTLLCLDCSDSVASDFENIRAAALNFVLGIEEEAEHHSLEENLAVVAMGGSTRGAAGGAGAGNAGTVGVRVVQHLTNDYERVREAIESLVPGGKSPLFEALVVCSAAVSGKGGTLTVQRCHEIHPRAVVFTDGKATEEDAHAGPDSQANDSNLRVRLIRLVNEFCDENHHSTPNPIAWVPVGNAAKSFLQSLANIGKGEMVPPAEVRKLCKYYRMQTYIGQVYKCMESMGKDKLEQIRHIVVALILDASPEDQKYVEDAVRQKIESGGGKKTREPDDYENVVNREKEGLGLFPLGTRVCRGPDWKWNDQDKNGPGTVINHSKKDLWAWVLWDSGKKNQYRCGHDGFFDLQENNRIPRCCDDGEMIAIGVKVVRGQPWTHGDEDGGPGSEGIVIRVRDDGKIKVRWSKTGHIGSYNYGKGALFEVKILDPAEFRESTAFECEGQQSSPQNSPGETTPGQPQMLPLWEWQNDNGERVLYDDDTQKKLERDYQARKRLTLIQRNGQNMRILFGPMLERTVEGESTRCIFREEYTEEDYELKKATALSLQQL